MSSVLEVQAVHQGEMRVLARARGHEVQMDYPLVAGQETQGATPLEMLLASLAACAADGVALLMRRSHLAFEDLEVGARGVRREDHPTVITEIHLEFRLKGPGLDMAEVQKVIDLAESRICPVWAMLKGGTAITTSLIIQA